MSKESFRDLKNEIELQNAEIDEMSMELESKNEFFICYFSKVWKDNGFRV